MSHAFWQTHLGGREAAIGSTLTVQDQPFTVVGVTPARFHRPRSRPVVRHRSACVLGGTVGRQSRPARPLVADRHGPAQTGLDDPTGGCIPACAEPRPSRRHGSVGIWRRPDGPVSRLSIWRHSCRSRRQPFAWGVWNIALAALRPHGTGASDHVRQSRDAHARSCKRARTGDRSTRGHWRVANAGALADADRKPAGGCRRRGAGRPGRAAVGKGADGVPRYVGQPGDAESHGRLEADLVRRRECGPHVDALRPRPCAPRVVRGSDRCHAPVVARLDGRSSPGPISTWIGCRTDRGVAGPDRLGLAVRPELSQSDARRCRLRAGGHGCGLGPGSPGRRPVNRGASRVSAAADRRNRLRARCRGSGGLDAHSHQRRQLVAFLSGPERRRRRTPGVAVHVRQSRILRDAADPDPVRPRFSESRQRAGRPA